MFIFLYLIYKISSYKIQISILLLFLYHFIFHIRIRANAEMDNFLSFAIYKHFNGVKRIVSFLKYKNKSSTPFSSKF